MYGAAVAELLRTRDLDAVHVRDVGLGGASDSEVLGWAIEDDRIVVTDNIGDFELLVAGQREAGELVPVVIVRRTGLGTGGNLHTRVTDIITRWCQQNPEPYRDIHWADHKA